VTTLASHGFHFHFGYARFHRVSQASMAPLSPPWVSLVVQARSVHLGFIRRCGSLKPDGFQYGAWLGSEAPMGFSHVVARSLVVGFSCEMAHSYQEGFLISLDFQIMCDFAWPPRSNIKGSVIGNLLASLPLAQ
jgi:hypothetical protein